MGVHVVAKPRRHQGVLPVRLDEDDRLDESLQSAPTDLQRCQPDPIQVRWSRGALRHAVLAYELARWLKVITREHAKDACLHRLCQWNAHAMSLPHGARVGGGERPLRPSISPVN